MRSHLLSNHRSHTAGSIYHIRLAGRLRPLWQRLRSPQSSPFYQPESDPHIPRNRQSFFRPRKKYHQPNRPMRPSAPGCTATAAAARRAAATLRPLSRPALRRLRVTTAPSPSLSRPLSQLQKRIPLSGQVVALPSSRCVRPRRAQYHSHDHPKPSSPFSEAESTILAAAHARVPEYGFSAEALALGARDAGYLDISAGVVPDGAFGLVRWHLVTRREALAARAQELFGAASENGRPLSMTQKVEALVWERLMGNKEVVGRWQEVSLYIYIYRACQTRMEEAC